MRSPMRSAQVEQNGNDRKEQLMEYIEREAAKRKYCETCNWYGTDLCNGCATPMSRIPAADVEPVRHGKWIPYNLKECLYLCSECNAHPRDRTKYCPNCGARMDGGKNV